jgi:hypothetical protein
VSLRHAPPTKLSTFNTATDWSILMDDQIAQPTNKHVHWMSVPSLIMYFINVIWVIIVLFMGIIGERPFVCGFVWRPRLVSFTTAATMSLSWRPALQRSALFSQLPFVPYYLNSDNKQDGHMWMDIYNAMGRERVIFVSRFIDDEGANTLMSSLIYLDSKSRDQITLYLNIPGGLFMFNYCCFCFDNRFELLSMLFR